ncbi:phosphoribosylaminoimidazolesuccinocarboxamide synthase [Pilibacter termitis]|uniref:phosphoribosylaminoimidazolesuccinocarboxamide synthase n=1 Tax=Pilibacter termitis TaxID=263852 RepID=UPI00099A691D|nr:phosphoribosylaminoimidazolesuccinocarboxamide synthase [Pilibacter termitis]
MISHVKRKQGVIKVSEKLELVYEGKAKKLFQTENPNILWVEYLGQATALNGKKKDIIEGKGELNNKITSTIFERLHEKGIQTHFIKQISESEQLIEKMEMIPLEVVVRNIAAGSFTRRLAVEEGSVLPFPIVEFYYKEDALDDPFINDDHVKALNIATSEEIELLKKSALAINQALITIFKEINIRLVDFKLEFGKNVNGEIVLADEVSPDTCRLWDATTNERLDKDIYRKDLGDILPIYDEVLKRFESTK